MREPPSTVRIGKRQYRRVSTLLGADGQLHGIYRPVRGVPLPTVDWIGKPSKQDIEFFLWCMFETVARRPPGKGKHQTEQLTGPFISYGKSRGQRGSDFTARLYAAVRLLEILGETNSEACREVARHPSVEPRLRVSGRGRSRTILRCADFLDKLQIVRGLYNSYKRRRRRAEKLPRTDAELEFWWRYFLELRKWALVLLLRADHNERKEKHISRTQCFANVEENRIELSEVAVLVLKKAVRTYG
jgi:hypothetical protein